jgi:hypothetical protein
MKKLPWPEITVAVLVLIAGLGVFAWAHRDEGELEETKRRGEQIVGALESFRARTGAYPDSLPQLVPEYIAAIEQPVWGTQQWRYRLLPEQRTVFQISVSKNSSGYPSLNYDHAVGRFVVNN